MRERAPRGGEARQEPFTTSDPGQGEHHEPELFSKSYEPETGGTPRARAVSRDWDLGVKDDC